MRSREHFTREREARGTMLRNVLLCLDDSKSNEACQSAALDFAANYGSQVRGFYVQEPSSISMIPLAYPMPGGFVGDPMILYPETVASAAGSDENWIETQKIKRERATVGLIEKLAQRGIGGTVTVVDGDPVIEIEREAEGADLVIIGRGRDQEGLSLGGVVGQVLHSVHRPILVITHPLPPLERILVAFDGSHGSWRALRHVADMAATWKGPTPEVLLATVQSAPGESTRHLERALTYLGPYRLAVKTVVVEGKPGEVLPKLAKDRACSLVAMGAYGGLFLRELILGSTTQQVVAGCREAVLLCH